MAGAAWGVTLSTTLIVEILLALLTFGVSVGAFWSATRANRAQAEAATTSVDAAAYQRATAIYESAIEALKGQTSDLHDEVVSLQAEISRLRLQSADLSAEVTRLRSSNTDLREQIAVLRSKQPRGRL